MHEAIAPISLSLPLGMGSVNCYLLAVNPGFVLVDTGPSFCRRQLLGALERADCGPGQLRLVVITHGDFDHTGNARYLHDVFGAKIAMHADDAGMAERGDMFINRRPRNALIRKLIPLVSGFGKAQRFTPDLLVGDGDDLAEHGLEATVISIPGHSKGSIGVLTAAKDLFCGDLLANTERPALGPIIDDPAAAKVSVDKLAELGIGMVYPGHGGPFAWHLLGIRSA